MEEKLESVVNGYLKRNAIIKSIAKEKRLGSTDMNCILYLGSQEFTSDLNSEYSWENSKGEGLRGIEISELAKKLELPPSSISQGITSLMKMGYTIKLSYNNCERLVDNQRKKEVLLSKTGNNIYREIVDRLT